MKTKLFIEILFQSSLTAFLQIVTVVSPNQNYSTTDNETGE